LDSCLSGTLQFAQVSVLVRGAISAMSAPGVVAELIRWANAAVAFARFRDKLKSKVLNAK
jgi:hypothetical protein